MLSLNTFQNGMDEFDDGVLDTSIIEINSLIKQYAHQFRLLIEFQTETVESKIYKNGIIRYYLNSGYKVVAYPTFIYIDWGRINTYQQTYTYIRPLSELGNHFTGAELYLCLTDGKDMRKITFRTLQYTVDREIKSMNLSGRTTSIISLGTPTSLMPVNDLNNMFAPDLALYASKNPDVNLTFVVGGNLQIKLYEPAELYTDIAIEVLFGTHMI